MNDHEFFNEFIDAIYIAKNWPSFAFGNRWNDFDKPYLDHLIKKYSNEILCGTYYYAHTNNKQCSCLMKKNIVCAS